MSRNIIELEKKIPAYQETLNEMYKKNPASAKTD